MGFLTVIAYLALEIWVSLEVAEQIGTLATLLWILLGVFVGIAIIRVQGPLRMMQAAQAMREGRAPEFSLAAGFFSAFAGVLIMVPGFVSDALGLLLLLPFVQTWIIARFKSKFQAAGMSTHSHFGAQFRQAQDRGNVYEGESVDVTVEPSRLDSDKRD